MIPHRYFEYIRSRRGALIKPVFTHNCWDILALAALAGLCGTIYQSPETEVSHGLDYISLAHAMESLRPESAIACYRSALTRPLDEDERRTALNHLGFTLKRQGKFSDAELVWKRLIELAPRTLLYYEELAKYYEHRLCNLNRAAEIVTRALDMLEFVEQLYPADSKTARYELEHRMCRIRRKMGKQLSRSH